MASVVWNLVIALSAVTLVVKSTATSVLGEVSCERGYEPGLVHIYQGEMLDPSDDGAQRFLTSEIRKTFRLVRRHAGLTNSATTTYPSYSSGTVAGFLLFQKISKRELGPVEGFQFFWDSEPHVRYFTKFGEVVKTVNGQGAAAVQVQVCVPEKYREYPTGKYHVSLIVDVDDRSHCTKTVLEYLETAHESVDQFGKDFKADEPVICGQQTALQTAASGSASYNFNKQCLESDPDTGACNAYDTNDVGCVFNFNSASSRDRVLKWLSGESWVPAKAKECVKQYWFAALD